MHNPVYSTLISQANHSPATQTNRKLGLLYASRVSDIPGYTRQLIRPT